jgi:hypothetical protein
MPHRFNPPRVEACNETPVAAQMKVQRFLIDQLATALLPKARG